MAVSGGRMTILAIALATLSMAPPGLSPISARPAASPAGSAAPSGAALAGEPRTGNLRPLGHLPEPARWDSGQISTDLAFSRRLAFQGQYDGFKIIDISTPGRPKQVVEVTCPGGQGDVAVWGDLLFRSIDRPQTSDGCGGTSTPSGVPGFEGLHVFDIRDPAKPALVAAVPTDCGSHTQTLVPDLDDRRVLIYVSVSVPAFFGVSRFGNTCRPDHDKFDVVEVPLERPARARVLRSVFLGDPDDRRRPAAHSCHDIGAIAGDVDRATCAGNPRNVVFDISNPARPRFLYRFTEPRVAALRGTREHSGNWHSASFTWDGEVMVMGWEPQGGTGAECEAWDPPETHTAFFFDTDNGKLLGEWTLSRKQSSLENCTIHNYNVLPVVGRYVLVSGNFQSGTSVVDFTNPARAREIARRDPPALPCCTPGRPLTVGGEWASYWYNGHIYASDITNGLKVSLLRDRQLRLRTLKLGHLNPQTQEFSLR